MWLSRFSAHMSTFKCLSGNYLGTSVLLFANILVDTKKVEMVDRLHRRSKTWTQNTKIKWRV